MNELEKLEADLLALPVNSRASLARALIDSLDETADENAEALWVDEIKRRMMTCEAAEQRQQQLMRCFAMHVNM